MLPAVSAPPTQPPDGRLLIRNPSFDCGCRLVEAEADCSLALERDPQYPKALLRRAQARLRQGKWAEARGDLERVLGEGVAGERERRGAQARAGLRHCCNSEMLGRRWYRRSRRLKGRRTNHLRARPNPSLPAHAVADACWAPSRLWSGSVRRKGLSSEGGSRQPRPTE